MNTDKNAIIGLVLVGLILVFTTTDYYKNWLFDGQVPQGYESAPPVDPSLSTETIPDDSPVIKPGQEQPNQPSLSRSSVQEAETEQPSAQMLFPVHEERIVTLETDKYIAKISSKGPSIVSWLLKDYPGPDGSPVELIYDPVGNLSLTFPGENDSLTFADYVFELRSDRDHFVLDENTRTQQLVFVLEGKNGLSVSQTFTFKNDEYAFDLDVQAHGLGEEYRGFKYLMNWSGGLNRTEKNIQEDMNYSKAWTLTGDDIESFDVSTDKILVEDKSDWTIKWGAVRTKYFTAAIVPQSREGQGVTIVGRTIPLAPELLFKKYSIALQMPVVSNQVNDKFFIYLGPLQYTIVSKYGFGLEKMMDFGIFLIRPISRLVLYVLTFLYGIIGNYGLVIIVFSILVKLVLYPLTKKSFQSMKEMQKLQPVMAELKEKYADNPQKMNEEMMALYRNYGVNPLSGCMPMLLQMPVLFALFVVFRSTIELRGAYFFGWITDLSAPDTVYQLPFSLPFYGDGVNILPLIMGLTMYLQQKATISDPKQKAMIYLMPALFTFMFNNFPSGLTLYYTLFNIFSVIQQKYVPDTPLDEKQPPPEKKKKQAKTKPKSRMDIYKQQARSRKK